MEEKNLKVNRHNERITVMEILYTYDMRNDFVYLKKEDNYSEFVLDIVNYVINNLTTIDEVISNSLVNYTLKRLSFVDRAIIRGAVAEIKLGTPKAVVINEALEIVKAYSDQGDKKAVHFVNKVLDTIANNL